jgi:hypothetical protein
MGAKSNELHQILSSLEDLFSLSLPDSSLLAEVGDIDTLTLKEKVQQLVELSDELTVRSAQASRNYLEHVAKENQMWIDFDERMGKCENLLRQLKQAGDLT